MQRVCAIHRWLIIVLVLLWGCVGVPVRAQQYGTFKSTSCYRIHTTNDRLLTTNDQRQTTNDQSPTTYRFRSTSAGTLTVSSIYTPQISDPFATSLTRNKAKRDGNPWDDEPGEDDDPIGVVPDPAPLGEPLVLLLFAFLFLIIKNKKRMAE